MNCGSAITVSVVHADAKGRTLAAYRDTGEITDMVLDAAMLGLDEAARVLLRDEPLSDADRPVAVVVARAIGPISDAYLMRPAGAEILRVFDVEGFCHLEGSVLAFLVWFVGGRAS